MARPEARRVCAPIEPVPMLLEGMDWRRTAWTARPRVVGQRAGRGSRLARGGGRRSGVPGAIDIAAPPADPAVLRALPIGAATERDGATAGRDALGAQNDRLPVGGPSMGHVAPRARKGRTVAQVSSGVDRDRP